MTFKLPDSVSSPQDLASLIMEIQEYARWYSHEKIKKQAGAKKPSEAPLMSVPTKEVLDSWQAKNPLSRESLDTLIKKLTEYKTKAPSLTITLAAPPPRPVKEALVGWCRKNIAPHALVTFQFNATILGGMVVRTGSHVFDWSFRRKILDSRSKFTEVLRRV